MAIQSDGFISYSLMVKVGVFMLVQALVYLILSKSSNVFSKNKMMRSPSFRPMRSLSVRRMLALLADIPPDGEPSPQPRSLSRRTSSTADHAD